MTLHCIRFCEAVLLQNSAFDVSLAHALQNEGQGFLALVHPCKAMPLGQWEKTVEKVIAGQVCTDGKNALGCGEPR